jgi:hypothetical protein
MAISSQRLDKRIRTASNTDAKTELLDAVISVRSKSYQMLSI